MVTTTIISLVTGTVTYWQNMHSFICAYNYICVCVTYLFNDNSFLRILSLPPLTFYESAFITCFDQPDKLHVHPDDSSTVGVRTYDRDSPAGTGRALTTSMQGGYLGRTPAASPPLSHSPGDKTAVPVWWRTRCLSWVEPRTPHTQSTWHETRCPELASRTRSVRYVPNIPGTFLHTS